MQPSVLETKVKMLAKELHLPTIGSRAVDEAKDRKRSGADALRYLVDLLEAECFERQKRKANRQVKAAGFPRLKTLEGFSFARAPQIRETHIRRLAVGEYIESAEPVIFLGEPGTGKTHLAISLGMAAAEQGRRVRFRTAAGLVTELVEAKNALNLSRTVARYAKVDLLILDELAYLPFAKDDAELLFRVLGERQERRPVVVTTNLPFGEWTTMFPDPRLCRAIVDRLTHKAHIVETGDNSIRLGDTLAKIKQRQPKKGSKTARGGSKFRDQSGATAS